MRIYVCDPDINTLRVTVTSLFEVKENLFNEQADNFSLLNAIKLYVLGFILDPNVFNCLYLQHCKRNSG